VPDEIDLNDEEEAALSRAWARLAKAPRPDATFAVTGPDLSGLGDLLNLSRQEVLDVLFDAAIDSFDLALPDAAFGGPDQPRVPAGQPGGGEWTAGGGAPPRAVAGEVDVNLGTLTIPSVVKAAAAYYVRARGEVDGRRVLSKVPNTDSIASSLDHYEVLPGIRAVTMADLGYTEGEAPEARPADDERRVKDLAERIAESKKISPLIVVDDGHPGGPYVLEGSHRIDALQILGAKAVPALVVLDLDGIAGRVRGGKLTARLVRQGRVKAAPDAPFYSPDQPRVPAGQPGGGRWAGGVAPGTTAARDAASDAVRAFAAGKGPPTAAEAEALAGHLARLTVSQIHALKAEHGLKGSAPNKAALVQKLAERFRAHRAANPVAPPPPAPAPAAKTPVPKEPPVPPRPPSPAPPAPPAADAAPGAPWLPADRVRAMDPREERDLRDFTRSTLAPALTGPETRAIDAYTGDDFTKINAAARGESDDPRLRRSVNAIDRVLRKAPLLPRPVYAYRGINVQPDVAERLTREFEEAARTGGTVTLRGFQSTSLTPGLAHGFATTISARKGGVPLHFEIRAREGMYVDPLSDMGGENELLLPRDRQYRVVGVSESVPVRGVSKPVRYVQMEQVWDQTKPTASSALKPISSSTEVLASAKSLRDLTASETIHRLADAEGTPPPAEVEGRVRTLAAGMTSEQLRAELGIPRGGKDALIRKAAGQILERVGSLRRSRI
jgi:hypothetical protein